MCQTDQSAIYGVGKQCRAAEQQRQAAEEAFEDEEEDYDDFMTGGDVTADYLSYGGR